MKRKYSPLDFQYPTQSLGWDFNWPWQLYGGWKSFFYKRWEHTNKNGTRKLTGIIIFGFKKLTWEWQCEPMRAAIEWVLGKERLLKYLYDLCKEENSELEKE